jgi:hypothetical protein
MRSKKAVSLSIETIIILILAIIALIVLLFIFSSGMREIVSDFFNSITSALGLWGATGVE